MPLSESLTPVSTTLSLGTHDYPPEEQALLREHRALLDEWENALRDFNKTSSRQMGNYLTRDGFFPYYSRKKPKILFLGRDSYGMQGCDYIETFFKVYRWEKRIGAAGNQKHLNQHLFHARMLHVAWGIHNKLPDWEMIPWASTIGDDFGTSDGISFAFLNLGKIRLLEEGTQADWKSIDLFCELSAHTNNFITRQIELLSPDIMISMNLDRWLDYLGDRELLSRTPDLDAYRLKARRHDCLLLNTWHFSARKNQKSQIYQPVCDALRRWDTGLYQSKLNASEFS